MALSPEQEVILKHPPKESGRVLAGPGTGKTYTSVMYLAQLAKMHKRPRVRYITFTRATTAEFAAELDKQNLLKSPAGQPPRTMHAYSLGILLDRKNRKFSQIPYPLRIPDDWEQQQLIRPDISRLLRENGYPNATPSKVAALEAEMSAGFESLPGKQLPIAAKEPKLVKAYRDVWREHRLQYGYTLLSELPFQAAAALAANNAADPGVDLLIVDEYQDLNRAEQQVLQELHKRGVAILAIGDDDQSIYSWRHAAPDGIRDFTTTFAPAHNYPLTICRRSGAPALEVATQLINQDLDRRTKAPLRPSGAASTAFRYLRFSTNADEAAGVARIAQARLKAAMKPDDKRVIAVLVRSDVAAWAAELQPYFDEIGEQLAAPADVDSILSDRGVRTALALGQLIRRKGNDSLAWRALLKVTPGIGDKVVDHVYRSADSNTFAARLLALHDDGFPELRNGQEVRAMVQRILDAVEKAKVPKRKGPPNGKSWAAWLVGEVKQIEVDAFTPIAEERFKEVGDKAGQRDLDELLNKFQAKLREPARGEDKEIRIMTMGMSKGLTFDTAIVIGAEEGNIPDPRSDRAEERRYLYVALTRAKHMTVVTYAEKRTGPTAPIGQSLGRPRREPSSFMAELNGVHAEDGAAASL
jgi:DNA helicase II / ATP-dependent DNA helicase PcrA